MEGRMPITKRERRGKADRVDLANKLVNLNINTDKIKAVSFWNSPNHSPKSVKQSPREFHHGGLPITSPRAYQNSRETPSRKRKIVDLGPSQYKLE